MGIISDSYCGLFLHCRSLRFQCLFFYSNFPMYCLFNISLATNTWFVYFLFRATRISLSLYQKIQGRTTPAIQHKIKKKEHHAFKAEVWIFNKVVVKYLITVRLLVILYYSMQVTTGCNFCHLL